MTKLTLGSLFDGIAGFPLSAQDHGIETLWSSEIEPFPMKVAHTHFPHVEQLGDVTRIDGRKIRPVDIITFGSPCQDLSVANAGRAGLEGQRSSLFYESVRIINEMREVSNGRHPRYAVWENVPGALSSNKGEDFRSVIESLARVVEPEIVIPRPGRKWTTSGMVRGNGWSIAWRILDAQYFGVPQRRRRIVLIADFGSDGIGEVLLEREGVSGHSASSREARHGATAVGSGGNRINCLPSGISGAVSSKWAKGYGGPAGDERYNLILCGGAIGWQQPSTVETADLQPSLSVGQTRIRATSESAYGVSSAATTSRLLSGSTCGYEMEAVRRLTPTECERLQGFPDGYTAAGSDSARYKALGNSIARTVFSWVFGRLVAYHDKAKAQA